MEELLDVRKLKALSKESRIVVAGHIRRDNDLWNAVNGLGGLSEFAAFGRLQGTVQKDTEPFRNALVIAKLIEGGQELKAATDQNGYYVLDLAKGLYSVRVEMDGIAVKEGDVEVEIRDGYTSSHNVNHVSPIDEGTKLLNESTADPVAGTTVETVEEPVTEPTTETSDPTTTDPVI